MSRLLSKKAKRIYFILFIVFALLFVFRIGYGYTLDVDSVIEDEIYFDSFSSDNKKNYASDGYKSGKFDMDMDQGLTASSGVDQKYEKIAEVNTSSKQFDEDETYVRNKVESNFGIVQYERKTGNDDHRKLQLQIGVPPANFDTLYNILIKIGKTHSKEIIKNDKTNDYLELNARKASLEKTLASLIVFKEKNGRIDEYINLENRILEIEENLQQLGVNLGDFDESNAFCTIQFSLAETKAARIVSVSFYHRAKVALEWTIAWYLRVISILFFITIGVYCLVYVFEKRKNIIDFVKSFKKGNKEK
ncbi:MAG: DUF4349 domain-containing protein [Crocinitomix sp.]|nr:DUF4349 domain-containing protein [Crocinitomix sp.]